MKRYLWTRVGVCVVGAGLLSAPLATTVAQASTTSSGAPTVVVSGLNNPRQLSLSGDGVLYIAEAGAGGTFKSSSPELGTQYIGPSGSISQVGDPSTGTNETPNRIITGFLSAASKNGSAANGSDGVSVLDSHGPIRVQETYFPTLPPFFGQQSGDLFKFNQPDQAPTVLANISAYEANHDPDGQGVASDPYAVLQTGDHTLVADAAGNDILKVEGGSVQLFHVFPNVTTGPCASQFDPNPSFPGCNFVPTAMAKDSYGDVFVTGLASLTPKQGQLVELDPTGTRVLATWSGFTAPDGVAVGHDGTLYVSELFAKEKNVQGPAQGVVTRIAGGSRTQANVPLPAGLAIDPSGHIYVSAFSIAPAAGLGVPNVNSSGQVWRLTGSSFH